MELLQRQASLSELTRVDHHVSAVLAKLGVPTRGAASYAARLEPGAGGTQI